MAVEDAYADATAYRDRTQKTDTGDDATIDLQLLAISRIIDRGTGRFFTRDVATVNRTYFVDPLAPNARMLLTDDIATKTGLIVTIDEANDGSFAGDPALVALDFELLPLNAEFGPEPKPWTSIHLASWGNRQFWPPGKRVQVAASFGWPAIPQSIIEGTIDATAQLRLETPRATQTIDSMGSIEKVSPTAASIVKTLIHAYMRRDLF